MKAKCLLGIALGTLMLMPLALGCAGRGDETGISPLTTDVLTTEPLAEETDMPDPTLQLIPDLAFRGGMQILSQKDHANGQAFSVLDTRDFYQGGKAPGATWKLGQWDSGPCLFENLVASDPNVITDGQYRTFAYDSETNTMTFRLDTSLFYQGKPAGVNDYWPHLLIEQGDFGAKEAGENAHFYRCDAEKIVVSFDIRLTDYEITPIDGDWVQAAQFLLYFYVKGTETQDFCWFGLQLFDNRWERNDNYIGYDSAIADASNAMIYSIGSKYLYKPGKGLYKDGKPNPEMDFVHVEIDITGHLKNMFKKGKADGYFKADSLSGLCINGMNLGWETIGTFDHTMEVRNLQIVSWGQGESDS